MEDQSQSFLSAVFRPGPTRERPPPSATGRDHVFERVPRSAAATNAGTW